MSELRRGLGRGLGALIPTAPSPRDPLADSGDTPDRPAGPSGHRPVDVLIPERRMHGLATAAAPGDPAVRFAELPVGAISPNPRQPRSEFDEDAMAELVASIREVGLLQPVVVRPVPQLADRYELVVGERRWRAAREAGLSTVPAVIRATTDDAMLRDALLENLHRRDLNPLEEAAAYEQLLDDAGCTHEELAARVGRSRPHITNTIRLLRLPPAVQRRVAVGVLSAGHARALLALEDPRAVEALAQRIVAEGLSVRATEEIVTLGEAASRATRHRRGPTPPAPELAEIAARLSDRFDTRVRVDLGPRKGRIVVEFASLSDLERLLGLLEPDSRGASGTPAPVPGPEYPEV